MTEGGVASCHFNRRGQKRKPRGSEMRISMLDNFTRRLWKNKSVYENS
jgi:hypothetical protein